MPGALALVLSGRPLSFSVCFAPLVSLAAFQIVSIALQLLGMSVPALVVVAIATVSILIVGIALKRFSKPADDFSLPLPIFISAAAVTFFLAWFAYFRPLGYETSIVGFDTVYHIDLIQAFVDSGTYSSLNAGLYIGSRAVPLVRDAGFYPASWHMLCAFVSSFTTIDVAVVVNAANCVFCSACFACGQMVLFNHFRPCDGGRMVVLAVVALLCVGFPWAMLVKGETFPQFAAFCLLPITCALFDCIIRSKGKGATEALCMLCALFTLGTLQPNSLFSLIVFIVFDCLAYVCKHKKGASKIRSIVGVLTVWMIVWIVAYVSPFMSGVVSFEWAGTNSLSQALARVLTLALGGDCPHLVLALFMLCGILISFRRSENIWVLGPFLFAAVAYVVCTSCTGFLKHFLGGFWYTDPSRLSAQLSIFAFPSIAIGAFLLFDFAESKLDGLCVAGILKRTFIPVASLCLVVAYFGLPTDFGIQTPMFNVRRDIERYRNEEYEPILSSAEISFAEKVKEVVEPDALIVNVPDDGSGALYGLMHLNVYYKRNFSVHNECLDSKQLRKYLNSYTDDANTKEAVEGTGAAYVLLLDSDDTSGLFHTYKRSRFKGLTSISEMTPGFELVLSEGDCRLYRITERA